MTQQFDEWPRESSPTRLLLHLAGAALTSGLDVERQRAPNGVQTTAISPSLAECNICSLALGTGGRSKHGIDHWARIGGSHIFVESYVRAESTD